MTWVWLTVAVIWAVICFMTGASLGYRWGRRDAAEIADRLVQDITPSIPGPVRNAMRTLRDDFRRALS